MWYYKMPVGKLVRQKTKDIDEDYVPVKNDLDTSSSALNKASPKAISFVSISLPFFHKG